MHANASAIRVATVSRDDDVGWVIPDWEEIPNTGSAAIARCRPPVAKDRIAGAMRPSANGKDSCDPSPLRGEGRVTHRINASVDAVQPSRAHPTAHSLLAYPDPAQLSDRHDPVLPLRSSCHQHVGSGDFPAPFGEVSRQSLGFSPP
jgi:hypothetical protein